MMKNIEDIALDFELDSYDVETIKGLLERNDGKLKTSVLRAHLSKGYGACATLLDVLVENGLAKHADKDERLRYLEVRKRGWDKKRLNTHIGVSALDTA